jgi:hypothetical protein
MKISERVKELARDLRTQEPRSAYEELGGEAGAARTLDKCRATLAGWNGDYQFGCPLDQHFFQETGIDMNAFREFVATGASDEEVSRWIAERIKARR